VTEPEPKKEVPVIPPPVLEPAPKKRSFVCKFDDCDKKFIDQALLKEHMASHGEKQVPSPVHL
jgi:hypothetical protein